MNKIPNETKKELLAKVMWDYKVSPDVLLNILENKQDNFSHIDRRYLINKCFNYLNWYQFISLFDREQLLEALEEIKFSSAWQERFNKNSITGLEFAKRFLRKETLSASG